MISAKSSKFVRNPESSPRFYTNITSGIAPKHSSKVSNNPSNINNNAIISRLAPSARRVESALSNNASVYTHPPLPEEPTGLYDSLFSESDMALAKKKFVKVTSTGEVEMEPDRVEFCIKITTNKQDINLAKISVKKRRDFVLAALKKFRIHDEDITVLTIVRKVSAISEQEQLAIQDDLFLEQCQILKDANADAMAARKTKVQVEEQVDDADAESVDSDGVDADNKKKKADANKPDKLVYFDELSVKCDSLVQYIKVFSICNEKLDRHVTVSQPVVRFTPGHIQGCTQRAVRLSMKNATLKGTEMIGIMKQRYNVGKLYYSVEDSLTVTDTEEYNNNEQGQYETFTWKRLNKIVRCNLTSVFELEHVKRRQVI